GTDHPSHFVQSLMLTASGPKPVRAIEKILLVDGIHQVNDNFLHDLILQAGNRDWPLFPVLLGDIDSAQRLYLILACHEPPMQLADVLLGVDLVLCVRDPVDPGAGILSQTSECLIQLLHCSSGERWSRTVASDLPWRVQLFCRCLCT